ncbi:hypothetical protein HHK36_016705 [Tetracentron sinense]|uniref:Protein CHUP1, chloroplastic n=1 Tax=Tetracentron sinense TaxID=13715 RepID=A0A835DBR8_TETSI|nr:hypothetical protein HHK36_016705 [Tetracentron sinense]
MESTGRKAEFMKPIFLKAGIPLALSVAGLIYSMITTRRKSLRKASTQENQESSLETNCQDEFMDQESFHSLNSTFLHGEEGEEQIITDTQITCVVESLRIRDRPDLEEEILGLRCRVDALQEREWELEMRFLHYCGLKERELILMELRNIMLLEIAHVEYLGLEVLSMEAENRRVEALVIEYFKIAEQLKSAISDNRLLRRKVKKLLRMTRENSRVLRQQASKIQAKETEVSRSHEELERREHVIKELNDEISELRIIVDQLQEEKKEIVEKPELAEISAASETKAEETAKEDYSHLLTELEQLQKDRAAEVKELIYLRWSNACLRHELMKNQEQKHNLEEKKGQLTVEYEGNEEKRECGLDYNSDSLAVSEHGESCLGVTTIRHACPKRPRLLHKIRKWVDGNASEKCKRPWDEERHQNKRTGRLSVSDGAVEEHHPARKSCSSA